MSTKTISLKSEAYEKLKAAKRFPSESFSQVVLRATWPEETITADQFLRLCRERGRYFSREEVAALQRLKDGESPPEDKWVSR